jgi:methionyl aminopeptidase
VCHGIPGDKKLKAGDIVNIDVTVIKDGWHGDTSRMFYLGTPSIQAKRLVETTFEAMWRGIRAVKPGARLGDIGHTIQEFAEGHHFSVVREFCGQGSAGSSTRSRRSSTTGGPVPGCNCSRG